MDDALNALLATGARHADDRTIEETRRVQAALSRPGGNRSSLPPPWSMWHRRRGRTDGPVGQLPLAADLEDLEGCNLRFDALQSREDGFSVQLAASPGMVILDHPRWRRRLIFWVEDERGNAYLGIPDQASGSEEMAEGELEFSGPIDPTARLLRLLPTGRKRRGVVEISLDRLAGRP